MRGTSGSTRFVDTDSLEFPVNARGWVEEPRRSSHSPSGLAEANPFFEQ